MISTAIRNQLRRMLSDHDRQQAIASRLYDRRKELRHREDELTMEIGRLRRRRAGDQAEPLKGELSGILEQLEHLEADHAAAKARCAELAAPLTALAAELKISGTGQFHTGAYTIESLQAAVGVGGSGSSGAARDVLHREHPDAAALVALQAKIAEARSRRDAAAKAPLSLQELRQRVSACIDVTVRNASLSRLEELGYPPRGGVGSQYAIDLQLSITDLIVLDRDAIEKRIVDQVQAAVGKQGRATSASPRREAIESAEGELSNLEPQQELELLALERGGWMVPWGRTDIQAKTILAVWREHLEKEEEHAA